MDERVDPQQMLRPVTITKFRGYEIDHKRGVESVKLLIETHKGILVYRLSQGEDVVELDYMAAKTLREILMEELNVNPSLLTRPEVG